MVGPFLTSPWDKGSGEHWWSQGGQALSKAGTITLKTDGRLEKPVLGKSKGAEAKDLLVSGENHTVQMA